MLKVAIQLYSVRQNMEKDPLATIERVVNTGYKYLETANHQADKDPGVGFGLGVEETKALLQRTGAQIVSAHISPLDLKQQDQLKRTLEFQQAIGVKYVATNLHDFDTPATTMRYIDFLNRLGEVCKSYGIELVYHNHYLEFAKFDNGDCAFDLMMRETDPALLKIQLDTYWAMRGLADPVAVMKQYGPRVRTIHQKDFPKGKEDEINVLPLYRERYEAAKAKGELVTDYDREHLSARELDQKALALMLPIIKPDTFTEVGTGIMDIQSIITAANEYCQSEYIILEQDFTKLDEFDSIQLSIDNFRKYDGITFP